MALPDDNEGLLDPDTSVDPSSMMDPNSAPDLGSGDVPINPDGSADMPVPSTNADGTMNIVETEDGGAEVHFGDADNDERGEDGEFNENMAEYLDDTELSNAAMDLLDLIGKDVEAREERNKQYEEGIKRTGLGNEAPGGAEFEGASKMVHPMMAEGCVDFAARAIKELFPANGPVKTKIYGEVTEAKQQKADRKKDYLNYLCTKKIQEYRNELEVLLSQLPLGGSQYQKFWRDRHAQRTRTAFVPIDNVYLPRGCNDFYSAYRVTEKQEITRQEFETRVRTGLYRDVEVGEASVNLDSTGASEATDKVQGVEEAFYNQDGLRTVSVCYVDYKFTDSFAETEDEDDEDQVVSPYLVHIDDTSKQILGVYRNWEEGDDQRARLPWMVEYKFIPWRGPHGIGLPQLIGSLSGALTGGIRALLDSAHINNTPSAVKLKGERTTGSVITINPTEIVEVEGPTGTTDIRDLVMPLPFNPPSAVLFQLIEYIEAAGKGVVSTATEEINNVGANAPVGTTLSMIEQGSMTYSAIHSRMHTSQAKALEIIHRLEKDNIEDETTVEELGELIVYKSDFQGPMDVAPVSDPNIFSEAQRFAQTQALVQIKADPQFAPLFKGPKLLERILKQLQIPNYEELVTLPEEPQRLDPASENVAASRGKPLKAFPEQDDMMHLQVHIHFVTSPIFAQNQMMFSCINPILSHIRDHLLQLYTKHVLAATQQINLQHKLDPNDDKTLAHGAALADQELAKKLAPLMQGITQAQQALQKLTPPPPPLPQVQVAQANNASREKMQQADLQAESQATQQDNQRREQDVQERANQAEQDNAHDVQTRAMDIAAQMIENERTNQTNIWVAAMKAGLEQAGQHADVIDMIVGHAMKAMEPTPQLGGMPGGPPAGVQPTQQPTPQPSMQPPPQGMPQ